MSRSGRPAKREMKKFEMPFEIWFLRGAPAVASSRMPSTKRLGIARRESTRARLVGGMLTVGVDGERDLVAARARRREARDERRALAAVLAVRDELTAGARRDRRRPVGRAVVDDEDLVRERRASRARSSAMTAGSVRSAWYAGTMTHARSSHGRRGAAPSQRCAFVRAGIRARVDHRAECCTLTGRGAKATRPRSWRSH